MRCGGSSFKRNQVSALGKEFADQFAIGRIYARDKWRVIVFQGLDAWKRLVDLQIERENRDAPNQGKAEEN